MNNRHLAVRALLLAAAIEAIVLPAVKLPRAYPNVYFGWLVWHIVPFKVLGWVDSLHPLSEAVFIPALFVMQVLLLSPFTYLLLLWSRRRRTPREPLSGR